MKKFLSVFLVLSLLFVMASCSDEVVEKEYSIEFSQKGNVVTPVLKYDGEEVPALFAIFDGKNDWDFGESTFTIASADPKVITFKAYSPETYTNVDGVENAVFLCTDYFTIEVTNTVEAEKEAAQKFLEENVKVVYGTLYNGGGSEGRWYMEYNEEDPALELADGTVLIQYQKLETLGTASEHVGLEKGVDAFGIDLEKVAEQYKKKNIVAYVSKSKVTPAPSSFVDLMSKEAYYDPRHPEPGIKVALNDFDGSTTDILYAYVAVVDAEGHKLASVEKTIKLLDRPQE